ncbi:MAG: serine/threonine-protein kinase [Vulcanimicrobiota bacterium]
MEEMLGPYKVVRELGRGAMGTVYLARHESLGRDVAIKALSNEVVLEPESIERFRREGKIAARLRHPNIVQVYDFFEVDGRHFIAMEYLGSRTLEGLIRERGPLPLTAALRLTDQLLDALHHAHEQGIVHRDIKPANVMITDANNAALTDFSIAHMKSASKLTQAGSIIGTPEYMAPEQFDGKCDWRCDLYATGLILYEMLTGFCPFQAETISEIMKKQILVMPDPPSEVDFTIPQPVSQVVIKCLAKDPDARYQSAAEMRQAIREAYRAGNQPQPTAAPVPPVSTESKVPAPPTETILPPLEREFSQPTAAPSTREMAPGQPAQLDSSPPAPATPPATTARPTVSGMENFLENHATRLQAKGGGWSLGLIFLGGLLPPKIGVLLALFGVLGALLLAFLGFVLTVYLIIRRQPLVRALTPGLLSIGIGCGFMVIAVWNSIHFRH